MRKKQEKKCKSGEHPARNQESAFCDGEERECSPRDRFGVPSPSRTRREESTTHDLAELRLLAARYGLPIEHLVGRVTLRPREIARALGVSLRSVQHWIATDQLPAVRIERTVMVPTHDLLRFLEENRHVPGSRETRSLADQARALLDREGI